MPQKRDCSLPMEMYPIPLHRLLSNQWSLISPIGPAASQTWRFGRGKMFTYDFCLMLQDYGPWDPAYFEAGMPWVAAYAALEENPKNESRGYLHPAHEVHRIRVGPLYAGKAAVDQTRELGKIWDARGEEYYEDAPEPIGIEFYGRRDLHYMVVRSCLEYLRDHGARANRFMTEEWIIHFQARTGVPVESLEEGTEKYHLMDFLLANVRLIAQQLTSETEILATWYRTNPDGHRVKEMRDGEFSLCWPDGTLANFRDRLGTVGLAAGDYTALKMAVSHWQDDPTMANEVEQWRSIADELRRNTIRRFWISSDSGLFGYFGMAIQRNPLDPTSGWQTVDTRGSGPLESMDGLFLMGLPQEEYEFYLAHLVTTARSENFLTPAGFRMVAAEHAAAFDFDDYQWSTAVWTVMAGRIAAGFQRHGMHRLARDARRRPTNASVLGGVVREFYIAPVEPDSEPFYLYASLKERPDGDTKGVVRVAPNDPEGGQGFSNSVILAGCMNEYFPIPHLTPHPSDFQRRLEEAELHQTPEVPLMSPAEADERRRDLPVCYVDMESAKHRAADLRARYQHLINPIVPQ